jgi:hypothetical protein
LQDRSKRVLAVVPKGSPVSADLAEVTIVQRPKDVSGTLEPFLAQLKQWFSAESFQIKGQLASEPHRLLNAGEFRAAVISAMTLLETRLVAQVEQPSDSTGRVWSVRGLIDSALVNGRINSKEAKSLSEWMQLRNMAVHTDQAISKAQARQVVTGVEKIVKAIE